MLNHPTLDKLQKLRPTGMAQGSDAILDRLVHIACRITLKGDQISRAVCSGTKSYRNSVVRSVCFPLLKRRK